MKKTTFLILCLILIAVIILSKTTQTSPPLHEQVSDLDFDNKKEVINFYSPPVGLSSGSTDISINGKVKVSIEGYFQKSNVHDLSKDTRILEVQASSGGKLINSILYRYYDGELTVVPISADSPNSLQGIWSSGGTEFKDNNSDGILEMFVYHRHYPPEAKRTVEIYRFNGNVFQKIREYEEDMPNVYL